jgi:hypothetical protein
MRALPVYFATTSLFVVLKYALYVPLANAVLGSGGRQLSLGNALASNFVTESIVFWCVLGVVHATEYYRHAREAEVRAARLTAELSDARLDALAAQLHPHFLFNTLQAISVASRQSSVVSRESGASGSLILSPSTAPRAGSAKDLLGVAGSLHRCRSLALLGMRILLAFDS